MNLKTLMAAPFIAALAVFTLAPAHATLIDFEDLPVYRWQDLGYEYEQDWSYAWDYGLVNYTPLTTQYEHLGVIFGEGDLDEIAFGNESNWGAGMTAYPDAVVSGTNAIMSVYHPGYFSFRFVGDDLPEYVSFYVTSRPGPMYVTITDASGAYQQQTIGYVIDGDDFYFTDEVPVRMKLEFFGSDLEQVRIGTLYEHRTTVVYLDDLYFGAAPLPVSGPGSLALLLAGLAGLMTRRVRTRV